MNTLPSLNNCRTVEEVFENFKGRRTAIVKALTIDVQEFYAQCDPEKDNLCLFGNADENWKVNLPAEDIPSDLPEPTLGINLTRDSMEQKDWLSFVAAHSDAWLFSVAFYFATKHHFDSVDRNRLFTLINELPTISETVTRTSRRQANAKSKISTGNTKKSMSRLKGRKSTSGKNSKKGKDEDANERLDEESEEDGETLCGVCGEFYTSNGFWICCDGCDKWFHGKCVKVTKARANHMEQYKCPSCNSKRGRHDSS